MVNDDVTAWTVRLAAVAVLLAAGWAVAVSGRAGGAEVPAATAAATAPPAGPAGVASLPVGAAPAPVPVPHFPDRLHAFIWRNWTVVEDARLAAVLGTSVENVRRLADSLGLPPQGRIAPEWRTRGYITVLRRNWHLLPYEQLLTLLDVSADELAYRLREDDFLFIKLGSLKPKCPPLTWSDPSDQARSRAARIAQIVRKELGQDWLAGGQERFAFIHELSAPRPASAPTAHPASPPATAPTTHPAAPPASQPADPQRLRYIYSYFAMYGDPLADEKLDPYPDGLLQRLAEVGVNGVWLHTVLRQLAPSPIFPEFGQGSQTRLANLRRLVERAGRHGIRVYLYMNEPRAMPDAFFAARPQMRGAREGDHFAVCTSDPQVRQWLSDSLEHVFKSVPGLGGVFTITASENYTSCASHNRQADCPRCKTRPPAAIIAEVNAAIDAGVRRGSAQARTLCWDWGWPDAWAPDIIAALPKTCWLMSVSEWSKPITRGGVASIVGEYSISAVGPGPRAQRHWALARQAGLKVAAKVQFNNTWELSAVPYLPVPDLVARHASALSAAGVDAMMLSWSLGGYPSPNLQVAQQLDRRGADVQAALDAVARSCFGPAGAADGRKAWSAFSAAFEEFPYHISVLYVGPQQYGPANLLYAAPTGYAATMIGFPYDAVDGWRGPYPGEVFAAQMEKVAAGWQTGLAGLERAVAVTPADRADQARAQLTFARVAGLHFRSVANQTRYTLARNRTLNPKQPLSAQERQALHDAMTAAARDELAVAREAFALSKADSRVAYEASNHYYYLPIDLAEKIINCRHLLDPPTQ